jgi:hypothetical protein
VKFWNSRPREKTLQDKIIMLREDTQMFKNSYIDMETERDALQVKIDALKENTQTNTNSFIDIQNKYNVLKKLFDENIKIAKQEQDTLKQN